MLCRNITPVKKESGLAAAGAVDAVGVWDRSTNATRMHSADDDGGYNDTKKPVSAFRSILPQILAVNVKNVLLFGYGMTLGFPTILIPAILGGEGRESTIDNKLHLSKEEISWLSTYIAYLARPTTMTCCTASLKQLCLPSWPGWRHANAKWSWAA